MKTTETEREIYLKCKDHSVSGESFVLYHNETYDMLETFPQPKPNELSRYYETEDYISHTDARKSFIDKLYQAIKNFTLKRKLRLIDSFNTEDKTLLDIGCGTGDFLVTCSNMGWKVSGVEPSEKARSMAANKLTLSDGLYADLPETDQQYDVITLWHALEHIIDLDKQIDFLKKHLKPSGYILVAVPNFKSYDAKHYKSFWAAYDVPRHLWHFSKTSIAKLFSEKQLQLVKTKPMLFDSFYVALLSEKYKKGKQHLFKAFFIGLRSNMAAWRTKEHSSVIYILKHG